MQCMKDKKQKYDDEPVIEESIAEEDVVETQNTCHHCDEYILGWKRALADYDNLKKDLSGERSRMREHICEDTIQRIIPVLDNFDAALAFKPEGLDDKIENWLQGLLYVRTQLETVLSELGASTFGQIGDVFDANLHDAAGEKDVEAHASGAIVEIVRRGWKRADHIIRPAKVIVSK